MPIVLDSQQSVRSVQGLPFCYLCGAVFEGDSASRNRDHVPPSSLFLPEDRNHPLILPTHTACNGNRAAEDQMLGSLVGLLHGKAPSPKARRVPLRPAHGSEGEVLAILQGVELREPIRRWVRGFHAALYGEYLDGSAARFSTTPPAPEGDPDSGTFPIRRPVVEQFVAAIKKNRLTNTLDRVTCRNGKCNYECVWVQADRGQWFCIYALNVYNWVELGDTVHFDRQGCVGAYRRAAGGVPRGAAEETRLHFDAENREKFDPFGE